MAASQSVLALPPEKFVTAMDEAPPTYEVSELDHAASVLRIVSTGSAPTAEEDEKAELRGLESKCENSTNEFKDVAWSLSRHKHERRQSRPSDRLKNEPLTSDSCPKSNGNRQLISRSSNHSETNLFEIFTGNKYGDTYVSLHLLNDDEKGTKNTPKRVKSEKLASSRLAVKRSEKSAIRWAPMNIPLHRRLQTLVVLCHTLSMALSVSIFFFLCAIPLFWPLLIPYMIYCMSSKASTSGNLSHRSEFLRSSPVWSLFASYFPATLHRSQELVPTRKYIFGYHPHGIISMGAFAAFSTEALGFSQLFPGIKNTLLTLDSNFRIPLYRDYALAMGLASVSKESCENLLSKGGPNKEGMSRAITIVIGGARESLDAQPDTLRLVLKRRKGFVKMAIRTGADLVPVLGFGENDIYEQVRPDEHPKIHRLQLLLKKLLGFTIPLFHARGVFNYDVGLMPYRRPLNIVVGRPIKVVQDLKPEQDAIDRVHEEYVQELERIWETWKDDFAPRRREELQYVE